MCVCVCVCVCVCYQVQTVMWKLLSVCEHDYAYHSFVSQVKEILQEEEDLSEIVQLVGKVNESSIFNHIVALPSMVHSCVKQS